MYVFVRECQLVQVYCNSQYGFKHGASKSKITAKTVVGSDQSVNDRVATIAFLFL